MQEPVVIVANGDFPSHKVPLLILQDSSTIICCDGAANHLVKNGMEPNYILGDMDSIDDSLKNKYKEQVIELPDQNENDLRKVIQWVEDKGVKKTAILGATGKRDDHSLANIFTLLHYHSPLKMTMFTNHGIFSVVQGEQKFNSFTGQQVSIFTTDSNIEITSVNLKYILNNKSLSDLYSGSLNESTGTEFSISISQGKILVYREFA